MFDNKKFKATKVDGVMSVVYEDENAYKNGTEIPFKTLKEVAAYQSQYVLDATTAAVDYAKKEMKKDKSIDKVNVEFPYSVSKHGKVTVDIDREKQYRNTLKGDGEIISKPAISVKVKDPSQKVSKPKISAMVDDLIETFSK